MQDIMIRLLTTEQLTLIVRVDIDTLVKDLQVKELVAPFDIILMEGLVQALTSEWVQVLHQLTGILDTVQKETGDQVLIRIIFQHKIDLNLT